MKLHLKSGIVRNGLGVTASSGQRVSGALYAMDVSANVQVIARLAIGTAWQGAPLMGSVETIAIEIWTARSVTTGAMCQHVREGGFRAAHDRSIDPRKSFDVATP